MSEPTYPQLSYEDTVGHCKYWADEIRAEGVDTLVEDEVTAAGISDQLVYPLDMQTWLTEQDHPALYIVRDYAGKVDNDHTDRAAWETLLDRIDNL